MHVLATYFHGAGPLSLTGLDPAALLAVPVLGAGVAWGLKRLRRRDR